MKRIKFFAVIAIIALAGCLWVTCDSGGGDEGGSADSGQPGFDGGKPEPKPDTFVPVTDILYVGGPIEFVKADPAASPPGGTTGTKLLKGYALPANANNKTVVWTLPSDKPAGVSIALAGTGVTLTVDKDAYLGVGPIEVDASVVNGKSRTETYTQRIKIPLVAAWVPATGVIFDPPTKEVTVDSAGNASPFAATVFVTPTDASNKTVTWGTIGSSVPKKGLDLDPRTGGLSFEGYRVEDKINGDRLTLAYSVIGKNGNTNDNTGTYVVTVKGPSGYVGITSIDSLNPELLVDKAGTSASAIDLTVLLKPKIKPLNATYGQITWTQPATFSTALTFTPGATSATLAAAGYEVTELTAGDSLPFALNIENGVALGSPKIDTIVVKVKPSASFPIESIIPAPALAVGSISFTAGTSTSGTFTKNGTAFTPLNAWVKFADATVDYAPGSGWPSGIEISGTTITLLSTYSGGTQTGLPIKATITSAGSSQTLSTVTGGTLTITN